VASRLPFDSAAIFLFACLFDLIRVYTRIDCCLDVLAPPRNGTYLQDCRDAGSDPFPSD
jgi:hypothetical protein